MGEQLHEPETDTSSLVSDYCSGYAERYVVRNLKGIGDVSEKRAYKRTLSASSKNQR